MSLFKRKYRKKQKLNVCRIEKQIEMVEVLTRNGYTFDEIFDAIGFSEVSICFMKSLVENDKRSK